MRPLPPSDVEEVLARVGPLWRDLAGARLLLTGCTGFFGPWLLETLLAAPDTHGLEAWALTRDPAGFRNRFPHLARHPALHLVEGDVRTFGADAPFTHVVHGAASFNPVRDPQGPEAVRDIIEAGTANVLALAAGARRLLFLSSGAIYGPQPPDLGSLDEDRPGAPGDPYARAKLTAEALCAASGLPVTIARCFAFLAPHLPLDAHFAAGNFLRDALAGRPIQVAGDGRPVRTYLYGTDLAVWLWTLLLKGEPGRTYNVGSDQQVTIEGLARAVAAPRGLPVVLGRVPGEGPAHRYVPSIQRARRELGLAPAVDLAEAIRRTLAWCAT